MIEKCSSDERTDRSSHKRKFLKTFIPFIISFLLSLMIFCQGLNLLKEQASIASESRKMANGEAVKGIFVQKRKEEVTDEAIEAVATSQQAATSTESVELSDTYTPAYSLIQLRCWYPSGESYMWEIYNAQTDKWKIPADCVDVQTDELGRHLSVLSVQTGAEDVSVRCTVFMAEGETVTDEAVVHIIPDIEAIEAKAEDYTADAGTYISGKDIPLLVSYADGTQDTVTGLYGVTFMDRQEDREYSVDENGHAVETVTTINTIYEYARIEPGDRELLLRCRAGEQDFETKLTVSGKDAAPVVSVSLENPEDWCETNKLIVNASDYSSVEYRFINEEEDSGWTERNEYAISRNGMWEIQVRDTAGNISSEKMTVSNIDNQKPVIEKIVIAEEDTIAEGESENEN